jgi:DNA-binding MarR family transcriptional regulator
MDQTPSTDDVHLPALLWHAHATYEKAMRQALERAGYDNIPANGLYIVGRLAASRSSFPLRQLVMELGISKQGAGQLVDALVMRGYLSRTINESDRRQLTVALTDQGRAAAAVQTQAREKIDKRLLACVGKADVQVLRNALMILLGIRLEEEYGSLR